MGTQFGQNCLCLPVGRAKAHVPGVLIMFPCALPWEEEPKDRLLLQNLMAIRITPDSFIPESRTSTQSPTHPTSWLFWWGLQRATGVFGGRVHLLSLPSIQQMLLAYCLGAGRADCWKSS